MHILNTQHLFSMYPHSYLDRCIRPLGYSFTRNVCTLLLLPTELLVQNQSTSPSGYQRGLWIYLGTHDLQILSPANVALQLTDKFFKGLMLSSLWAERHITSATWTFISSICYHVLFELWANPCNVGSRAKPLLAARFPPLQLWDAHLRHCQLPRVARTRLFVLPSLFMFLSLPLNYSLTKGLINSYAGQLKRIVRDQFCSTDNEVAQKPSLSRRKGTFPLTFWSCSKPVDGEESSGHVKSSDKAWATWRGMYFCILMAAHQGKGADVHWRCAFGGVHLGAQRVAAHVCQQHLLPPAACCSFVWFLEDLNWEFTLRVGAAHQLHKSLSPSIYKHLDGLLEPNAIRNLAICSRYTIAMQNNIIAQCPQAE